MKSYTHKKAGKEVLERITSSLKKKEGFRHLWLGDTGMGKTTANRELLKHVSRKVDITLSIDDKNQYEAQYKGTERSNPDHLRREPVRRGENPRHIVFRGICESPRALNAGEHISSESVAGMSWDLVRLRRIAVLINIDELADAVRANSQVWKDDTGFIAQAYRKGRSVGISITAGTQIPQMLPREAFGLSDTIGIFRMTSREAGYLYDQRVVDKAGMEVIEKLEVGQWILAQKSVPNDFTIWKF